MPSPYLNRPLRSLGEALGDRDERWPPEPTSRRRALLLAGRASPAPAAVNKEAGR